MTPNDSHRPCLICLNRFDVLGKDVVGSFKTISTLTPHKTTKNGICCVALSADEANERILSGGMDKEAIVTERASGLWFSRRLIL